MTNNNIGHIFYIKYQHMEILKWLNNYIANVALVHTYNNSAPCAHCYFFNNSNLMCEFPKFKQKKCKRITQYTEGWETLEYIRV